MKHTVGSRRLVLSVISVLVVLCLLISATMAWFADMEKAPANFVSGSADVRLKAENLDAVTSAMEFKNLRPISLEQFQDEMKEAIEERSALAKEDQNAVLTDFHPVTVYNDGSLPLQVTLGLSDAGGQQHEISNVIVRDDGGVEQDGTVLCAEAYGLKNILKVLVFANEGTESTPDWQLVMNEKGQPLDLMEAVYQPYTMSNPLPAAENAQFILGGWLPESIGNAHQAEHFHGNLIVQAGQTDEGADVGTGDSSVVRPEGSSDPGSSEGPVDPPEPKDFTVDVIFQENAKEVGRTTYTFTDITKTGDRALTSAMVSVPTGCTYDPDPQSRTIHLDMDTGTADPSEVIFTVQETSPVVDRQVTVQWADQATEKIVGTSYQQTVTAEVGATDIVYPDSTKLPEGYALVAASPTQSHEVTITADGVTPDTVTFLVREIQKATREVTVQWIDGEDLDGAPVSAYTASVSGEVGQMITLYPDTAQLPNGWMLVTDPAQSARVTITADGIAPDTVQFQVKSTMESGDGSSWEQAIVVKTPQELNGIRNDLTKYYKLGKDIDLSAYSNWTPIGGVVYASSWFRGGFDGNGYKITNLNIKRAANRTQPYTGLFGTVYDNTGKGEVKLKNVVIENASIEVTTNGTNYHAGVAVGFLYGASVENCHTSGTITTKGPGAGGVVGATLSTSYSSYNGGHISRCSSDVTLNTNVGPAGGIVGNVNIPVSECYFTGDIVSTSSAAGGIAGAARNSGSITDCWSSGSVKGAHVQSGGVAGIVGDGLSTVRNCYTVSAVHTTNAMNPSTEAGRTAQPAVGHLTGSVNSVFFAKGNFQVKGAASSVWDDYSGSYLNGTGKTADELKTAATFAGWDAGVWNITDGGYPTLVGNP